MLTFNKNFFLLLALYSTIQSAELAPHKLHPVTERNLREAARISYILRQQRGKMSVYECKKAQKAFDYYTIQAFEKCPVRDLNRVHAIVDKLYT